MDETELAWAAGFFDGEGHTFHRWRTNRLGPSGKMYHSFGFSISQRHLEPLERFQAAVGGLGTIYTSMVDDKPMYRLRSNSRVDTLKVLKLIRPLCCSIKVEQMDKAIAELESEYIG